MAKLTQESGATYLCKSCDVRFIVPRSETPVCCPICRMNRIDPDD